MYAFNSWFKSYVIFFNNKNECRNIVTFFMVFLFSFFKVNMNAKNKYQEYNLTIIRKKQTNIVMRKN